MTLALLIRKFQIQFILSDAAKRSTYTEDKELFTATLKVFPVHHMTNYRTLWIFDCVQYTERMHFIIYVGCALDKTDLWSHPAPAFSRSPGHLVLVFFMLPRC